MQHDSNIASNQSTQAITSWMPNALITRCIAFILIAAFSNYGHSQSLTLGNTDTHRADTEASININYRIILDESKGSIKRTVEIELAERTDKETLKTIARKIKSSELGHYERTFIAYRIKGDNGNTYWATTHYNPDLEIVILGTTKEDYELLKKETIPNEKIIGQWMAQWGGDYKMVAYTKNGITYIKSPITSGSGSSDKAYQLTSSSRGMILQDEEGKESGAYFLINSSGDLEFWSATRNYYTAPKLKK